MGLGLLAQLRALLLCGWLLLFFYFIFFILLLSVVFVFYVFGADQPCYFAGITVNCLPIKLNFTPPVASRICSTSFILAVRGTEPHS